MLIQILIVLSVYEFVQGFSTAIFENLQVQQKHVKIFAGLVRSSINAAILSHVGWQSRITGYHWNDHESWKPNALEWFLGYLIHDTLRLPDSNGKQVDLLHHIASIFTVYFMQTRGYLKSHIPLMFLLEVSTIPLNICKAYDLLGYSLSNPIFAFSTFIFTISFIAIRVIWFGMKLYIADVKHQDVEWNKMNGLARWPVRLLYLMQLFWLKPMIDKGLSLMK